MRALVLLTDGFGGHGGIAKFNRDFLSALSSHARIAEVIGLPRLAPEPINALPEKLTYLRDGLGGKARYFWAVLKAARHLPKIAKRDQLTDTIIFCAHINLLPLAFLAHWITRAPVVLNLHGIEAWSPHRNPIVRSMLRGVSAFIAVSEFTKERFIAWSGSGSKPFFILPNCVDLSAFSAGPRNSELVEHYGLGDRKVIMTLARLSAAERYKGIDEVIEALPQLAVQVPNITYLICGDGDDRARLQAKAARLGVNERVVFAGRIPEKEKADYLRLADAFIMPGWGEGFGIVYLEALACGIPVIGSKIDGSREALRDGKLGTLVDPRNSAEIVSALLDVLKRSGERRNHMNTDSGVDYFSFDRFQQRVHAIIDAITPAMDPVNTPRSIGRTGSTLDSSVAFGASSIRAEFDGRRN